jgi:hypothetical protein
MHLYIYIYITTGNDPQKDPSIYLHLQVHTSLYIYMYLLIGNDPQNIQSAVRRTLYIHKIIFIYIYTYMYT